SLIAFASLIQIRTWQVSERQANQKRLPFIFDLDRPSNGSVVKCDFRFGRWEKNWMPFEYDGRLLALYPETAKCSLLYTTPHLFAKGLEVHGGTPPIRFDEAHFLSAVRFQRKRIDDMLQLKSSDSIRPGQ
ncbi:MAG: hypothetical protein SGPRY_007768, partial [Prymnesium sp.]